jgi:hypothetical protein
MRHRTSPISLYYLDAWPGQTVVHDQPDEGYGVTVQDKKGKMQSWMRA